jgi:hypothetical protein
VLLSVVTCFFDLSYIIITTITLSSMASTSSILFPKAKPGRILLDKILQLDYLLRKSKKDRFIDVWAFINLRPKDKENPYFWCTIPIVYTRGVGVAIFRYQVLKIAVSDTILRGGNQDHILYAQIHLKYMDVVLSRFFKAAQTAGDDMAVTWRNGPFDEWIRTEFHVRKHTPEDVETWKLLHPNISLTEGLIDFLGIDRFLSLAHVYHSLYILSRMGSV